MSRATRTKIPVATELLQPQLVMEVRVEPLEVVRLRQGKTWTPAIVDAKAETLRSYLVTTATGQQYRRNHKDLLQTGEPPPTLSVREDKDLHTTGTDTETQAISYTFLPLMNSLVQQHFTTSLQLLLLDALPVEPKPFPLNLRTMS